jgi:hypothetical protein
MIKPFKMPLTKRQRFAFLPVSIFATPSPYTEKTGAVVWLRYVTETQTFLGNWVAYEHDNRKESK